MARNRVIYQSQALYIAPNSTGIQTSGYGTLNPLTGDYTTGQLASGMSLLYKLDRVQNCNFNFTINRQDINELGQLARIDSIVNDTPTVGLDFSYYVTDGLNERLMGFNFSGRSLADDLQCVSNASAISGLMIDTQGNNYYILTVDEGEDVVGANLASASNSVIGIGNGFITEYSLDASVGSIPTASVTVEAFNIKSDVNKTALFGDGALSGKVVLTGASPAIDYSQTPATRLTGLNKRYLIGTGNNTTGVGTISALRPGDITLSLPVNDGFTELDEAGNKAHIQSFAFTIPLTRTVLQRLGNVFGFARVLEVPLNMDITINAIVNELQEADIFDQLCGTADKKNFTVTLNKCADVGESITPKIIYQIKGAILNSESFSTDIGGNQTVDLTYNVQIGGANDTNNGIFMSGSYTTGDAMTIGTLTGFYKLGTAKNY